MWNIKKSVTAGRLGTNSSELQCKECDGDFGIDQVFLLFLAVLQRGLTVEINQSELEYFSPN